MSQWLVLGVICWAVISALSDIRRALVDTMPTNQRVALAALSIGPSVAVIAVALQRRWWSIVGLAMSAGVLMLDVLLLDRARDTSVKAMFLLVAVIVAGAAAFQADRRVATIALAIYVGTKAWYLTVSPEETAGVLLNEMPVVAFLVGGAWLVGNTVRRRHAAEARVAELAAQAQLARERERTLLARELHDVVAHELTIIAMQASLMRLSTDAEEVEAAREAIESTSRRALDELKRLLQVLRTSDVVPETGAAQQASVAMVVDGVAEQLRSLGHEVEVTCHADGMPRSVELGADRILRESATNIVKHSPEGSRVWIDVTAGDEELSIRVANDGLGLARGTRGGIPSTRLGLPGLEERVSLLGGAFTAAAEGDTWVVQARLPFRPSPERS